MRRVSDTGVAVLCTIHQPSKEVFSCFDSLLLLQRGGRVVYFGDLGEEASQMLAYFEKNGAEPMNPKLNPADYMLDQIGAGTTARVRRDGQRKLPMMRNAHLVLYGVRRSGCRRTRETGMRSGY